MRYKIFHHASCRKRGNEANDMKIWRTAPSSRKKEKCSISHEIFIMMIVYEKERQAVRIYGMTAVAPARAREVEII